MDDVAIRVVEPEAPGLKLNEELEKPPLKPEGRLEERLKLEAAQAELSLFVTETAYATEVPGATVGPTEGEIEIKGFPLVHVVPPKVTLAEAVLLYGVLELVVAIMLKL